MVIKRVWSRFSDRFTKRDQRRATWLKKGTWKERASMHVYLIAIPWHALLHMMLYRKEVSIYLYSCDDLKPFDTDMHYYLR